MEATHNGEMEREGEREKERSRQRALLSSQMIPYSSMTGKKKRKRGVGYKSAGANTPNIIIVRHYTLKPRYFQTSPRFLNVDHLKISAF